MKRRSHLFTLGRACIYSFIVHDNMATINQGMRGIRRTNNYISELRFWIPTFKRPTVKCPYYLGILNTQEVTPPADFNTQ